MVEGVGVASYTKVKVKCMACGLHFVVCTDNPDQHGCRTLYCPECGQHDGRFIVWKGVVEGFIFQEVPGVTELTEFGM